MGAPGWNREPPPTPPVTGEFKPVDPDRRRFLGVERGQVGGPQEGCRGAPRGCGLGLSGKELEAAGGRGPPRRGSLQGPRSQQGAPGLPPAAPRLSRPVGAGLLLLPLGPPLLGPDRGLRLREAERQWEVQALARPQGARG